MLICHVKWKKNLLTNRSIPQKVSLLCAIVCEICKFVYVLELQLSVAIKLGEKKNFEKEAGPNPAGNPASSWPDCWPDCCAVLKKNWVSFGLESGQESGRIVTWQLRLPSLTDCFFTFLTCFGCKYLHFPSSFNRVPLRKREKLFNTLVSISTKILSFHRLILNPFRTSDSLEGVKLLVVLFSKGKP